MTFLAKIDNGQITRLNVTERDARKGIINFDGDYAAHGFVPMVGAPPAYDVNTQVLSGPTYEVDGNTVRRVWTLADKPAPSTNPDDYPLTPAQFKAMVVYLDKDAAIRSAIAQTTDALQRAWLLSRYENAESYNHGDPFLQSMRAAIGMSEADLSAAWMLAKDLKSGE